MSLKTLIDIENKVQVILTLMEHEGISCDKAYLKTLSTEFVKQIEQTKKKLHSFVGHEFNPASTKELSHELYEVLKLPIFKKTKTGYSTDEETLTKLEPYSEIVPLIKKFRNLSKIESTYVKGLIPYIDEQGLVHSTFNQTLALTGRISSQEPNLQNLPNDEVFGPTIKKAFHAKSGYTFISFDYSQIDLRALSHIANEKSMINAFKNGEDIHKTTAQLVFNKQEITNEERNFAKTINFGIVYGMEAYGLSRSLQIGVEEAQKFINSYYDQYPSVKKYFDKIGEKLQKDSYVETLFGRRRYFENYKTASYMQKKKILREAINMPVQGTSADINKIAMVDIFNFLNKEKIDAQIKLVVHDEIILEVQETEATEDFIGEIQNIMQKQPQLSVPITVNYKLDTNLSFQNS